MKFRPGILAWKNQARSQNSRPEISAGKAISACRWIDPKHHTYYEIWYFEFYLALFSISISWFVYEWQRFDKVSQKLSFAAEQNWAIFSCIFTKPDFARMQYTDRIGISGKTLIHRDALKTGPILYINCRQYRHISTCKGFFDSI